MVHRRQMLWWHRAVRACAMVNIGKVQEKGAETNQESVKGVSATEKSIVTR